MSRSRKRRNAALAVLFLSTIFVWPVFAQTSPDQGTNQQTATPVAAAAKPAQVYVPTSLAVAADVPRTPEGRPDFQDVVWIAPFFGTLEGMPMISPPELVLSEEKAKQAFDKLLTMFLGMMKEELKYNEEAAAVITNTKGFPIVRGERRTRLLALPADGKLPYTPEARREAAAAMTAIMAMKADNPEDRLPGERCTMLGAGPPIVIDFSPRQFFQTRDHIVILSEYGDDVRIAPFVRGGAPAGSYGGNAVAHWEGDTLVIETTGLPKSRRLLPSFPAALIINAEAKMVERFTRISREELLYQFTVEDPTVYVAPWMAEYSFFRADFRLYPSSCHEANYPLANILRGQRVMDAKALKAKPADGAN